MLLFSLAIERKAHQRPIENKIIKLPAVRVQRVKILQMLRRQKIIGCIKSKKNNNPVLTSSLRKNIKPEIHCSSSMGSLTVFFLGLYEPYCYAPT